MPFVNIKVIENVFSETQKEEMIRGVTEAIVLVEGENLRSATTVIIEEVKSGNWAIGGNLFSSTSVKEMMVESAT